MVVKVDQVTVLLLVVGIATIVNSWSYERRSVWDDIGEDFNEGIRHHHDNDRSAEDNDSKSSEEEMGAPRALGLMDIFGTAGQEAKGEHEESTLSSQSKPVNLPPLPRDEHGRVQMGVATSHCDDGKTNLTVDWDMSPVNFTCFHPDTRYPLDLLAEPTLDCVELPESYRPDHFCMNEAIKYLVNIPTHGDHRPLWPKFGEYQFVPRERWLHNIEHGSVVFLYHPCAHPMEVKRLKSILKECFHKHVITPSTLVTPERPLVLVAWGCRLQMAIVDDDLARKFIREKALHGPEGSYTKEGQFEVGLIDWANKTGDADYSRVRC